MISQIPKPARPAAVVQSPSVGLNKTKQQEKKLCNLKNRIQKNPNNKKSIKQLEGVLRQLRSSQPTGQNKPKITNEPTLRWPAGVGLAHSIGPQGQALALRKRMVKDWKET